MQSLNKLSSTCTASIVPLTRYHQYIAGVNYVIENCEKTGKWPAEFALLGATPRRWTGPDTFSLGRLLMLQSGYHDLDAKLKD